MPRSLYSLLVLGVLLVGCRGDAVEHSATDPVAAGGSVSPDLVVAGGWPDPTQATKPQAPWMIEAMADVVAFGTAGEPLERGGRQLLTLRLGEILAGEAVLGEVFPEDAAPFFGCLPPETIARPSELYPPGTELLIYLQRREGRLTILALSPRPASVEALRGFLALAAAVRAPEPDWNALLALADGAHEQQLVAILTHETPPGARAAVAAHLSGLVGALERDQFEPLMQRVRWVRWLGGAECLAPLGQLVDWLLDQGQETPALLAHVPDSVPSANGFSEASAEQKQAWRPRVDRMAAHDSLSQTADYLRQFLGS